MTSATAQILIHPTCTHSPDAIERLQRTTGRVAVIEGNRARLTLMPLRRATGISQHPSVLVPSSPDAA